MHFVVVPALIDAALPKPPHRAECEAPRLAPLR
jgi:hypothetical protein